MWYYIETFAKGFIGISKAGIVWGKSRAEVIDQIVEITYDSNKAKYGNDPRMA